MHFPYRLLVLIGLPFLMIAPQTAVAQVDGGYYIHEVTTTDGDGVLDPGQSFNVSFKVTRTTCVDQENTPTACPAFSIRLNTGAASFRSELSAPPNASCSGPYPQPGEYICTVEPVEAPTATVSYGLPLTAPASGSFTVSAVIEEGYCGAYCGNVDEQAEVAFTVPSADPEVTFNLYNLPTEPLMPGNDFYFGLFVRNEGPGVASGVVVEAVVPSGFEILSAASQTPCTITGSKLEVTCILTLDEGQGHGTLVRARVLDDTAPGSYSITGTGAGQSIPFQVTVESGGGGGSADLSVSKTVDRQAAAPGEVVTYTVTVSNAGPDEATGINVQENLPQGFARTSSSVSQGIIELTTGLWSVGSLAAGAQATLTLTGTFAAAGTYTNTAEVTAADQEDPDSTPADGEGDDYAAVDVTVGAGASADLSLECEVEGNKQGENFTLNTPDTLQCVVRSEGNEAQDATFTFEYPSMLFSVEPIDFDGWTLDDTEDGFISLDRDLLPGGTLTTFTLHLTPTQVGEGELNFNVSSQTPDPDLINNTQIMPFTISENPEELPDLEVSIEGPDTYLFIPELSEYEATVIVKNVGKETSFASRTLVAIAGLISTNISHIPAECERESLGVMSCANGMLMPGDEVRFSVAVEIRDGAANLYNGVIYALIEHVNPSRDSNKENDDARKEVRALEAVDIFFSGSDPDAPPDAEPERTLVKTQTAVIPIEVKNNTPEEQSILMDFDDQPPHFIIGTGAPEGPDAYRASLRASQNEEGAWQVEGTLDGSESTTLNVVVSAGEEGDGKVCAKLQKPLEQTACMKVTVEPERALPDLVVTAVPINPYVSPGEEYTVEVTVSNIGREASDDARLEFDFFFAYADIIDPPAGCEVDGYRVTCPSIGPLPVRGRKTFNFGMQAFSGELDDEAFVHHFATVIPAGPDQDETNHVSSALVQVSDRPYATTDFVPKKAVKNEKLAIRAGLKNQSDDSFFDVSLEMTTPDDCTVESFHGDGNGATFDFGITFDLGELPSNETAEWTIILTCSETGEHESRIVFKIGDEVIEEKVFTTEVADAAECTVTKTVIDDPTPAVGKDFSYLITVTSTADQDGVTLRDPLSNALRIPSGGFGLHFLPPPDCEYTNDLIGTPDGLECQFSLQANVPREFVFHVEPTKVGEITNIVEVCGTTATATVQAQDLVVNIHDPLPIEVGSYFSFTTTVTNVGTEVAPDVQLELGLYEAIHNELGVRFRSSSICELSDRTASCTLGALGPGESKDITIIAFAYLERVLEVLEAIATSSDGRRDVDSFNYDVQTRETIMSAALARFGQLGEKQAASYDVYVDGTRVAGDLEPGTATAFLPVTLSRTAPRIDITDAAAPDNSEPLASFTLDLVGTPEDSLAFSEQTLLLLTETPGDTLGYVLKKAARTEAADPTKTDVFFMHASADAPALDLRVTGVEADLPTLAFGESTGYLTLDPGTYRVGALDAATGEELNGFSFDLSDRAGQAVALAFTGRIAEGTFTLDAFDGTGTTVATPVEAPAGELPVRFALHGNYPNPFNPRTTLRFDLPESARVGVEVFDVLGRRVLVVPPQPVEAGYGKTLALDASALASGLYLYRVITAAETGTEQLVGRMIVIK